MNQVIKFKMFPKIKPIIEVQQTDEKIIQH